MMLPPQYVLNKVAILIYALFKRLSWRKPPDQFTGVYVKSSLLKIAAYQSLQRDNFD